MTGWERRIVDIFMTRYPASSAAAGGRPLRIGLERLFPNFEKSPPDEKESFLDAAESLEKQGLISIQWIRRRKNEALSALVFLNPEALFDLAGKPSPSITAEDARREAAVAGPPAYGEFFAHLAETLNAEDAVRGINRAAVEDLAKLTGHLSREGMDGITPRALSIRLYSDSKRLEALADLFAPVFSRAERRGITAPDFSALDRSFPETMIAGKLEFTFDDWVSAGASKTGPSVLTNPSGAVIGFPFASLKHLRSIGLADLPAKKSAEKSTDKTVLMIENKETFYALAERREQIFPAYSVMLYIAGHPNRAVQTLVTVLADSGFSFSHAGDLDVEGVLILQELSGIAGQPVTPVHMDGATFDRYRQHGRKLTRSMLRRASLINEATRRLPGIAELLRRIEETSLGIEQEIVDYR